MRIETALVQRLRAVITWATGLSRARARWHAVTMLATIAVADCATGPTVSLNALYLLPLSFVAWTLGGRAAAATGLGYSALTLYLNGFGDGRSAAMTTLPFMVAVWNAGMRIGTAAIVTLLVTGFRHSFECERRLARRDPLTGLLNRRAFFADTPREMARAQRRGDVVLLAYFDLDGFKIVNDRFGHAAGDAVLSDLAIGFRALIREQDLCARIGGDEFALLLACPDRSGACAAAERVHRTLSAALRCGAHRVSLSMGAVVIERPGEAVESSMMAMADALMYEVKRSGKNALRLAIVDDLASAAEVGPADPFGTIRNREAA